MKHSPSLILILIAFPLYSKQPVIVAHRGASGYEPENTLRAFERAIQMGAPALELDVHLSKSGDLVVIHNYTTQDKKKVSELTTQELKKYDLGKGEHIPLLSQVFDLVNQRAVINVELKGPGTAAPVAKLIHYYIKEKKWDPKNFIVSSFDHYRVREFNKLVPSVPAGVIFEGNPIGYALIATRANAHYAVAYYEFLTPEFINDAHSRGIKVYSYTVNDKETAQKLIDMNIDGIITNYPDLLEK